MENIDIGRKWKGRPWIMWRGTIRQLRTLIPTFTISDFSIEDGVNEFLSVITRNPLEEIDIVRIRKPDFSGEILSVIPRDTDLFEPIDIFPKGGININDIDPKSKLQIPISTVRTERIETVYLNWKPVDVPMGYKFIPHRDLFDWILEPLREFSIQNSGDFREVSKTHITQLTNPESLEATLKISKYGAKMQINFLVPNYKYYPEGEELRYVQTSSNLFGHLGNGDPFKLEVTCSNSMDKSIALIIDLSWVRGPLPSEGFGIKIPIARFHKQHDQELDKEKIKNFLHSQLERLINGQWKDQSVSWRKFIKTFGKPERDDDWAMTLLKRYNELVQEIEGIYEILIKNPNINPGINLYYLRQAIISLNNAKDVKNMSNKFLDMVKEKAKRI